MTREVKLGSFEAPLICASRTKLDAGSLSLSLVQLVRLWRKGEALPMAGFEAVHTRSAHRAFFA